MFISLHELLCHINHLRILSLHFIFRFRNFMAMEVPENMQISLREEYPFLLKDSVVDSEKKSESGWFGRV